MNRLVLTGGGTGGHVSPLAAVAKAIHAIDPEWEIHYLGQAGDPVARLLAGESAIKGRHAILSGKWRRYNTIPLWKQLLDLPTVFLNIRDLFKVGIGFVQALVLLARLRPAAIFLKGGDLSIPAGFAAAVLRVPTVTHDSDVLPGLGNRIGGRWAKYHAVGVADSPYYPYSKESMKVVGVPLRPEFAKVTPAQQAACKQQLELPADQPLIFVTGGGLGAWRLNQAVAQAASEILQQANLIIVTGEKTYTDTQARLVDVKGPHELRVLPFVAEKMHLYTGAADVVVTRNGATAVAELALQGKAAIVVPNPLLSEGHQLKNAEVLEAHHAAIVVHEAAIAQDPHVIGRAVIELLAHPDQIKELATNIASLAKPEAARETAELILAAAAGR